MEVRELNKDDVLFFILKNKDNKALMAELNRITYAFTAKYENWRQEKKNEIHPIYDEFREKMLKTKLIDEELADLMYNKEREDKIIKFSFDEWKSKNVLLRDDVLWYIHNVDEIIMTISEDIKPIDLVRLLDGVYVWNMSLEAIMSAYNTNECYDEFRIAAKEWFKKLLWL